MTSKFLLSRNSDYIKSVFDPKRGPTSNPDDRTVRHMIRQETVTASLLASQEGGAIIFYPNACATVKGFHYTYDGTNWTLQNTITIAQNINDNYNYGRQTAFYVDVRASTQSTSNAILAGTMNAVTYEGGGLSELGLQETTAQQLYNTILATTSNPLDKVGNVFAANGISILSLPNDADVPYTRLGDNSPSSGAVATYVDKQSNLGVRADPIAVSFNLTAAAQELYTFNIDAGLSQYDLVMDFTIAAAATVAVTINALGPFGNVLSSNTRTATSTINGAIVTLYWNGQQSTSEPICALRISAYSTTAVQISGAASSTTVWAGSEYGRQSPITIISYNGFIKDSTISVSGVANLELVPNTLLLRQVMTKYGPYDAHEFDYFKTILGMRDHLQIRTVMSTATYLEMKNLWVELGELDKNSVAEAFDIGSLIRGIKSIAVPALSAFIPGAGPMMGALSPLIDTAIDTITPVARAASGPSYGRGGVAWASDSDMSQYELVNGYSDSNMTDDLKIMVHDVITNARETVEPVTHGVIGLHVDKIRVLQTAMFPVVITTNGAPVEMKMYVLAKVPAESIDAWKKVITHEQMSKITKKGKLVIYGVESEVPRHITGSGTFLALPLAYYESANRSLGIETQGPIAMGTSWQAALCVLLKLQDGTCFPYPLTGAVGVNRNGEEMILENPAYPIKLAFCRRLGLPLLGADMGSKGLKLTSIVPRSLEYSKRTEFQQYSVRIGHQYKQIAWAASLVADYELSDDDTDEPRTLEELGQQTTRTPFVMKYDTAAVADSLNQAPTSGPPPVAARRTVPPVAPPRKKVQTNSELSAMSAVQDSETSGTLPPGSQEVLAWAVRTGLVSSLYQMSKIDPNGMLTYRVLKPLHEVSVSAAGGLTPAASQYNSAQRKAATLLPQYRGITTDWVLANGNRGPDDTQVMYYRKNGKLPNPGENQGSLALRPNDAVSAIAARGTTKLTEKINNLMKSDLYTTNWMRTTLNEFINEEGRVPGTEEINQLRALDPERPGRIEAVKNGNRATGTSKPEVPESSLFTFQKVAPAPGNTKVRASRFLAGLRNQTNMP